MRKMIRVNKENNNSNDIILIDGKEFRRYYHDGISTSYFISGDGQVYGDISKIILKQRKNHKGYLTVSMNQGNKRITVTIHKMVALTFIGPKPGDGYQIDHKDGNKENNDYTNLEWVTAKENVLRAWRLGLAKSSSGNDHPLTRYSDDNIRDAVNDLIRGGDLTTVANSHGIPRRHLARIARGEGRRDITENLNLNYTDYIPKPQMRLTPTLLNKIRELRYTHKMTYKQIQKELNIKSMNTLSRAIKQL